MLLEKDTKIIKNMQKNIFSDKFEILKAIKKKNKDLSRSIKSNIIKESFQNNYIKKY